MRCADAFHRMVVWVSRCSEHPMCVKGKRGLTSVQTDPLPQEVWASPEPYLEETAEALQGSEGRG